MNLNEALYELGWSRTKFAKRIGIDRNTVTRWGDGNMKKYGREFLQAALHAKRNWDWFNE